MQRKGRKADNDEGDAPVQEQAGWINYSEDDEKRRRREERKVLEREMQRSMLRYRKRPSTEFERFCYWTFVMASICFVINVLLPFDADIVTLPVKRSTTFDLSLPKVGANVSSIGHLYFTSEGVKCHGWLVLPKLPEGSPPPPIVLVFHGLGSQKDMGLIKYAEEFAGGGIASLLIDYRGFGGSDGMPRHMIDPMEQAGDVVAAAEHLASHPRNGEAFDATRLGLFGTSLGGGVSLVAAHRLGGRARAVVAQTPSLDGLANVGFNLRTRGVLGGLRIVLAALTDALRGLCGLNPAMIKLLGVRGLDFAILPLDRGEIVSYYSKHPGRSGGGGGYLGGWLNRAPARLIFAIGARFRPIKLVPEIPAPILFVSPEWDSVVPIELIPKAAALSPHKGTRVFKGEHGHFEMYTKGFASAVGAMVPFLQEHLAA